MRRVLACLLLAAAGGAWAAWPDEKTFVVGEEGVAFIVIDAATGKVLHALPFSPRLREARARAHTQYDAQRPLRLLNPYMLSEWLVLSGDGRRLVQTGDSTSVWDLGASRLELRLPATRALGFLGKDQARLALLGRIEGQLFEFAIWDVAAGRKVFAKPLLPAGARYLALPLGSPRFAAFAVNQQALWLWDDEKRALRQLELPSGYFLSPPLALSPDGTRLMVSGSASRVVNGTLQAGATELLSFDPAAGKLVKRHAVPRGNAPRLLGWTLDTKHFVVHQAPDIHVYDAGTGLLAHSWNYVPAMQVARQGRRLKLDISAGPLIQEPLLSPHGDRLALVDHIGGAMPVWDIRLSPPDAKPSLCAGGTCGGELTTLSFPVFSPDGRAMIVQNNGRLFRVDVYAGSARELPLERREIAAALSRSERPEVRPQTCGQDPQACAASAEDAQRRKQADAREWLRAACAEGAVNLCNTEQALAKKAGEPPVVEDPAALAAACDAGRRRSCIAARRFEQACFIKDDKDCAEGLREASRAAKPRPAPARPAPLDAPQLCDQFAGGRFAAVRYYERGEFAGLKVMMLMAPAAERWPFREGDILLDTVRCGAAGCSPERFVQEVNSLCRTSKDRLLHDLRLDVRSADAARNRAYLLRKAD